MNIGIFKQSKDGGFAGTIRMLNLNADAKIVPVAEKKSEKSPDFRIEADSREIGAGWLNTLSRTQRDYISLTFDDPALPAAVKANLVEGKSGVR